MVFSRDPAFRFQEAANENSARFRRRMHASAIAFLAIIFYLDRHMINEMEFLS